MLSRHIKGAVWQVKCVDPFVSGDSSSRIIDSAVYSMFTMLTTGNAILDYGVVITISLFTFWVMYLNPSPPKGETICVTVRSAIAN